VTGIATVQRRTEEHGGGVDRVDAYVLIQTDAKHEPLARALRDIPGVAYAEDLSGAYDAIALARSGPTQDLLDGGSGGSAGCRA
jgi:hypothetical protein